MQIIKFENKNLNIQKLQIMRKKIRPVLQVTTDSSNAENQEANVSLAAAKRTSIDVVAVAFNLNWMAFSHKKKKTKNGTESFLCGQDVVALHPNAVGKSYFRHCSSTQSGDVWLIHPLALISYLELKQPG